MAFTARAGMRPIPTSQSFGREAACKRVVKSQQQGSGLGWGRAIQCQAGDFIFGSGYVHARAGGDFGEGNFHDNGGKQRVEGDTGGFGLGRNLDDERGRLGFGIAFDLDLQG